MEGNPKEEAIHLMDEELLPQDHIKVTKNTENIELKTQKIEMMQGDTGYVDTSIDPLLWVSEEIQSLLKEASEDVESSEEDDNIDTKPLSPKLVDETAESKKIMGKTFKQEIREAYKAYDIMLPQEVEEDEKEMDLKDKFIKKEENLMIDNDVFAGVLGDGEEATEDIEMMSEANQKLYDELFEDERMVEEVMEKIKLMEERQEQLSTSLEAVAEHAARNEAYMEEIYSRSSEQLEDLLSAINKHVEDETGPLEEGEQDEKQENFI